MTNDHYSFSTSEDILQFEFDNVGPRGVIRKIVQYSLLPTGQAIYNLAFGNLQSDGSIDDTAVSDNGDMVLVLATVVQTLLHFFAGRPTAGVAFTGSTEARTRLYQILIARSLAEAHAAFYLFGVRNGLVEEFVAGLNYDAFLFYKRS